MPYQKLIFKPGVYKDDSPLEAEGYWIDADKIRFVRGLPETIYGWEKASNSTLNGICRGAMTWADNGRNPFAAFGTNLQLYAMDVDGTVTDITPRLSYGQASNPFTTTAGTATTVNITSHGLVATQLFTVLSQSATVGGITLSGSYPVVSVTDANNFVITTATATAAGPGGGTVNYAFGIVPGQADGLGGLGYGTGGFGSGGFGGSASGYTLYPRSWSLAQWGQNLIANPRGGGIYEWAPNATASELNPDTTFATTWTLGTGWTQATSTATAAAGSASDLSVPMSFAVGAWHILRFDYTRSAGTLQPVINSVNQGAALSAATAHVTLIYFSGNGGSQTVKFTKDATFIGTVTNVSVKVLTVANAITNAPTAATCIFSTSERIFVACGVNKDVSSKFDGAFDTMRIAWTDTQNNQTWTAAGTNLAGSYTLTNGSRIVRGLPGNRENVILTDNALYAMRYVPDPTVVYSFVEMGAGCGLIGPNAVCQVGGRVFWFSNNGQFQVYDGAYVQPLQCTLRRDIIDNLAWVQQDKIYCHALAGKNEVWWTYPDGRDGIECSRYVIYNYVEDHWSCGLFDRSAYVDQGIFQYPLGVDLTGSIWFHEKGFTADGGSRSWSVTSAYNDLGDGDTHAYVSGIQPDAEDLQGGYSLTFGTRSRSSRGIATRSFGPYNIIGTTAKINMRAHAQESKVTFAGSGAPSFFRLGAIRFDINATGRKR